jgi:integrase
MENIRWKDIEIKTQGAKAQFFIHVTKGKTTKYTGARKVVCKRDVIGALVRLRDRFPLRIPNQKLFLLANGDPTPQLGKAFEKALKSSNLKDSPRGPRTLYSLRHTYITWQLLAGTSMDVIARQCGTSAAMIEQHYSHVKPEMFADALSGVTFDTKQRKQKSSKALSRANAKAKNDEKMFDSWMQHFMDVYERKYKFSVNVIREK